MRVLRIAWVVFAFCRLLFSLAHAEPVTPSSSTSLGREFESVIAEIKAMIRTDTSQVPNFVVREATPDRIEKLFRAPEVVQLPKNVRENGLIFAGLGSTLLTFDKPSDIIAKISSWFPAEIAAARKAGNQRLFSHLRLWGPYEHWNAESTAFLSLWNCMPQSAWLRPRQNPFMRRLNDGIPLYLIAAQQSSYEEFDFDFCIHNRSGYQPSWNPEDIPRNQTRLQKMGARVAPLLRGKFAAFLNDSRCGGTGPDDCVLIVRLWASLSPSDTTLAATIQSLEVDVAPDSPLPELLHSQASWSESKLEDGQDRFDLGLRRAAFLRAKLQSVLNAQHAWPTGALSTTLGQLSNLRQDFAVPFVHRWYQYELDYRNDPINPWRIFDSRSAMAEDLRTAILTELERLATNKGTECEVFEQWFRQGGESLQTEYVLRRLRRTDEGTVQCGFPDFEWLRQQTDTQYRHVLYGYLALMEYLPEAEKNKLAAGLTNGAALCRGKTEAALPNWLRQVCNKGRSGKFLLREGAD